MTKNNKNLLIKCKSPMALKIQEAADSTSGEKEYTFEGIFTACSTKDNIVVNRNNRIYMEDEMCRHLAVLREQIKRDGFILGELDHPTDRFDTRLSEASHKITSLHLDPVNHNIIGRLTIIDTPKGQIAKKIIDAGYPCFVSSRCSGTVNEDRTVHIDMCFGYDIVCVPGFAEAKLTRVQDVKEDCSSDTLSKKMLNYLNESVSNQDAETKFTKEKYGFLCEGVTVCEIDQDVPIDESLMKIKNKPIDMKDLCTPLYESEEKEDKEDDKEESTFTLPQADLNPSTVDEGDDSKDDNSSDNSSDDSKSKDKEDKKEDKKTLTDEEKAEKRAKILGIEAVDSESTSSDEDKDEKRAKILDVEVGEENSDSDSSDSGKDADKESEELADILDDEDIESADEKCCNSTEKCDSKDNCKSTEEDSLTDPKKPSKPDTGNSIPNEIKTKEKEATAKEVAAKALNDKAAAEDVESQTKKDMDKIAELLKRAKKVKDVKESICQSYPFAISLSDENFAKFAALKPVSKNKVQKFIIEHNICDVASINELWATPLLEERRLMKNWLRLASEEDKRLFTEAPMDVQDAIEESAKYVMIKTKEDADKFWERTGLRQKNASKMINESMVQRYGIQSREGVENTSATAEVAATLGYSADYFKMLEDMY